MTLHNSIPLYFFSFYKALNMVIQEITKMQRAFLWNGDANHRRINRMSWFLIYKSKVVWGLGVKHCKMFNHALLSK